METGDVIKLIGSGGFAGVLLVLLWVVGMRIVQALDRVVTKIDAHTKDDLASHAEIREAVVGLHSRIDGILETSDRFTPVEGVEVTRPKARTPAFGTTYFHGTAKKAGDR